MILNPGEYFTVVRELADPNDTGVYYVQAKIRNARTGALLATLNLVDQTGQRFTKEYLVPQDASGLGFYISSSTRVYTDAAYTVLSDQYGQESETYLVDNRFRNLGGGSGGSDVDYKKIRKIFLDVLTTFDFKFPSLEPLTAAIKGAFNFKDTVLSIVKRVDQNTAGVQPAIKELAAVADRIDAKEFPKTDLAPVLAAIEGIPGKVDVTPATDLAPVLNAVKEMEASMHKIFDTEEFKKEMAKMPELADSAAKIEKQVKDFLYIIETKTPKEAPVEPQKPDYQKQAKELLRQK